MSYTTKPGNLAPKTLRYRPAEGNKQSFLTGLLFERYYSKERGEYSEPIEFKAFGKAADFLYNIGSKQSVILSGELRSKSPDSNAEYGDYYKKILVIGSKLDNVMIPSFASTNFKELRQEGKILDQPKNAGAGNYNTARKQGNNNPPAGGGSAESFNNAVEDPFDS